MIRILVIQGNRYMVFMSSVAEIATCGVFL